MRMQASKTLKLLLCVSPWLLNSSLAQDAVDNYPVRYTEQGWSEKERFDWYMATQGSRLMPADWFRALEAADTTILFNSPENMARYRAIFDEKQPLYPYPIGFAEDKQPDNSFVKTKLRWFEGQDRNEKWIGLNCSACHTTQVKYGKQSIRIDGGPSLFDFQAFDRDIAIALRQTLKDSEKFDRFAQKVLNGKQNSKPELLKDALAKLTEWHEFVVSVNHTNLQYGFARTDAFGHIFNKTAIFVNDKNPEFMPSDAPVNYPFLWNTPQHDKVQWNGIAANSEPILGVDFGALGRNAGEVIGVFGEVNVKKRSGWFKRVFGKKRSYSSVFIGNLIQMEEQVERLKSPKWPSDIFGKLDEDRVASGKVLFEKQCKSCHLPLAPDAINQPVLAKMSLFLPMKGEPDFQPPGTDPAMACRSFERRTGSGFYANVKTKDEFGNKYKIGEDEQIASLLAQMVTSSLVDQIGEIIHYISFGQKGLVVHRPNSITSQLMSIEIVSAEEKSSKRTITREDKRAIKEAVTRESFISSADVNKLRNKSTFPASRDWGEYTECMTKQPSKIKGYKARPLNGIWATAPYLHNGSVPNLYELLLPPEERTKQFFLGARDYDINKVGYITNKTAENSFEFNTHDGDGRPIWGNFNGGHDYNNENLDHEMRMDLVEYMKSL